MYCKVVFASRSYQDFSIVGNANTLRQAKMDLHRFQNKHSVFISNFTFT